MTTTERSKLLAEQAEQDKVIKALNRRLRNNTALFKDAAFEEERTQAYYKAWCIDCTLHNQTIVRYKIYKKGE
jgi:hypothetical protein